MLTEFTYIAVVELIRWCDCNGCKKSNSLQSLIDPYWPHCSADVADLCVLCVCSLLLSKHRRAGLKAWPYVGDHVTLDYWFRISGFKSTWFHANPFAPTPKSRNILTPRECTHDVQAWWKTTFSTSPKMLE